MAKKTREQKKAIRKQGWQQAKQGAKTLLVDMTKEPIEAGGKVIGNAIMNNLSGLSGRSNKVTNSKGPVSAFVGKAVANIPKGIHAVGQVAKGVFRGIFNHPDWYKYKGTLSTPAANIMRPFGPTTLKPVMNPTWSSLRPGQYLASGIGVTHYVNVGIKFNDMRNAEGFKLAMIEAFKAIRLDLRSNLPYTQEAYDNYINMACSVYVKAKAVEKLLGFYNYTRPDIPEFQRAHLTVPLNSSEVGIITPTEIAMVSEDKYATTVNDFKKLKSILQQIAIPRKLAEYLSWWVGSTFIDQAAPNPQIYSTSLRSAPIYKANSTNYSLDIIASWDIATGSVRDIIEEALDLTTVFGIMNADICKTGRYAVQDIVLPENYQPVFLNDHEFFSILINAYGMKHSDTTTKRLNKEEYIRVDALEELNDINLVGMSNALAHWAEVPTLCEIISQACYMQVDDSFDFPAAINATLSNNNAVAVAVESNGAWIQIATNLITDSKVKVTAAAGNETTLVSANSRADSSVQAAASSGQFTNIQTQTYTIDPRSSRLVLIAGYNASNQIVELSIVKGETSLKLYNATTNTVIATLTFSGSITWNNRTCTITGGSANIVNSYVATLKALIGESAYWYYPTDIYFTVTYAVTANATAEIQDASNNIAAWFCELVDYHIPVVVRNSLEVSYAGSAIGQIVRPYILLKECYKPMIFNLADIDTVLYWMYLGLFSME